MRVVIFFLCLCSLILKGNAYLFAGWQSNGMHATHSQHPPRNRAHLVQDFSVTDEPTSDQTTEYVTDDDEEDNTNNIAAAQYRLMARSHKTHVYPEYACILNYLCNCYKAAPAVCIPASDKYIVLGVLRI